MQPIENVTERETTVVVDGKYFVNCRFEKCVLVFGGGDFGWMNTAFPNCELRFEGPAARTLQFLKYFHIVPQQQAAQRPSEPPSSTTVH